MRLTAVHVSGEEPLASLGPSPSLVGSSPEADIRVEGTGVATVHARFVDDTIDAIAACTVGDVELAAGKQRTLVPFARVMLGDVLLYVDDETHATSVPTRELAFGALADSASLWPSVVVVEGPSRGTRVVLREERPYSVGRAEQSDLPIDALTVSRIHIEVRRKDGAVYVRDHGATRGTFLGEKRLAPGRDAIWTPHRMVRVGEAVLALSIPGFREPPVLHRARPQPSPATEASPQNAPGKDLIDSGPAPAGPPSERLIHGGTGAAIAEVPQGCVPMSTSRGRAPREIVAIALLVGVIILALAVLTYLVAQ